MGGFASFKGSRNIDWLRIADSNGNRVPPIDTTIFIDSLLGVDPLGDEHGRQIVRLGGADGYVPQYISNRTEFSTGAAYVPITGLNLGGAGTNLIQIWGHNSDAVQDGFFMYFVLPAASFPLVNGTNADFIVPLRARESFSMTFPAPGTDRVPTGQVLAVGFSTTDLTYTAHAAPVMWVGGYTTFM